MPLPASGPISFGQINVELGVSSTATRSLDDTTTRNLFGVASGAIGMSSGRGKSNAFAFSFAGGANLNLFTLAVNAGWNQSSNLVATNTGAVTSTAAGTPALTIAGTYPNGVRLNNNSTITGFNGAAGARGSHGAAGVGGNGGYGIGSTGANGSGGGSSGAGTPGAAGGQALLVNVAVSVNNLGSITGGTGGAGGAGGTPSGGGGGGGAGGDVMVDAYNSTPTTGPRGGNGFSVAAGGPFPGGAAADIYAGGNAGAGGASGAGGGNGQASVHWGGAGGAGGPGGAAGSTGATGANGNAITGNSNITYIITGTRTGTIA